MWWLPATARAATLTVAVDGTGDFQDLQQAISAAADGDVIEVAAGEWSGPLILRGRSLTLRAVDGPSATTLSSEEAKRLISVRGGSLNLEGFTLSNPGRGAIEAENAAIVLRDVVGTGFGGGALDLPVITHDGGSLLLEDCVFTDNRGDNGSVVQMHLGLLSILGGEYSGNFAEFGGVFWGGEGVSIAMEGVSFYGNKSKRGGVVHVGRRGSLHVSRSSFDANVAVNSAGAIHAGRESEVELHQSSFRDQQAKAGGVVTIEDDGRLYVDDCIFDYNVAIARGGAIYTLWGASVEVEDSLFSGNSAYYGYGGAIEAYGPVISRRNEYKLNFAYRLGGGIYLYGGDLRDRDSIWSDNTVFSGDGGAIQLEEAEVLDIDGSTFLQNNASGGGNGGAIGMLDVDQVHIRRSLFDDNFAGNFGGALSVQEAEALLEGVDFIDNAAGRDGGAVFARYESYLSFHRADFTGQKAGRDGGTLSFYIGSEAEIVDSEFSWSEAAGRGGTINIEGDSDVDYRLKLERVNIHDSVAGSQGGAIMASGILELRLEQVQISRAEAGKESFGGAVYAERVGELTCRNGRFTANTAAFGGAVYTNGITTADEEWTNNVFDSNEADFGGAICLVGGQGSRFWNNTLVGNEARQEAGAFCAHNNPIDFRNNLVAWTVGGAAFHLYGVSGQESVSFNDWWENEAGDVGGAWEYFPGDRNMNADPQLVHFEADDDPHNDQLQLVRGSPLIDMGDPFMVDPDGSRVDIGAFGGPGLFEEDRDGDGFPSSVDCNDNRARIYPGADEVNYDGIDQDCSGGEDQDLDDDGLVASELGGPDCDDNNAFVRQCVEEKKGCSTAPAALYLGLLCLPVLRRRRR